MICPKISIAIAVYNNGPYIERCVASVISQTYKNIEIIIVDDGSNDDSFSKCALFKNDSRIIIIKKREWRLKLNSSERTRYC